MNSLFNFKFTYRHHCAKNPLHNTVLPKRDWTTASTQRAGKRVI